MSLNHAVGDGTAFWHLFNTWSEISRRLSDDAAISSPLPVHRRWFLDGCRVPIPLPFAKVEDIASYGHSSSVQPQDCFLHFSAESVKKLKAKANAEASGTGTATISSLQALLAHLWVAVCRARRLAPDQSTTYVLLLDPGAACTAYRWATRATPWHAPRRRPRLASWARNLTFACTSAPPPALVVTGNSPRFDVYGNDFGWGQPVAVRRSSANKMDGTATVFQGRGGGGSMALQVCLAPEVLARRVTDDEFMSAVTA
ncbi:unnamed protein product [Triticum turgidum subsp. durum]|uniref:Acetyltransferase n=1 Tax=Triticum turgidum subsp. durum TaxID=4567 RepID=A0A9R1Q6H4_TRITD|nr:unnamed protein product [Triticum turgidum subsp. durum]